VSLPAGKSFDGISLAGLLAGEVEPKPQALMKRAIRTDRYRCLFQKGDHILLAETPPEPTSLQGQLFDLEADPIESRNLFTEQPTVVAELLEQYRQVMRAPYLRAQAARGNEQPTAAFAISAAHFRTAEPLPQVRGATPPVGWSRAPGHPHSVLMARGAEQPLKVDFRVPDGRYRLFLSLDGEAEIEVGDQRKKVTGSQGEISDFGVVEVRGRQFAATLHPPAGQGLRIFFIGFIPPGARFEPGAKNDTTRQLRALGYIQ
jgi:hypothetical protein